MNNRFIALIFIMIFSLTSNIVFAEQPEKEIKSKATAPVLVSKSVIGVVGVIRPKYITIIYDSKKDANGDIIEDYEMLLPIDDSLQFVYKKKLEQFSVGDKVEILYDETNWLDEEGRERMERKAKQLKFIEPAVSGLRSK